MRNIHRRILLSSETNGPDLSYSPLLSPTVIIYADVTPDPPPRHLSNSAIAVVSAVSAALFLALTYYSVLRHRRRQRNSLDAAARSFSDDEDSSSDYEIQTGPHHHAWNVRTLGIDDSSINSIGSYAYLPSDGGKVTASSSDCPVCLGEFSEGEMVRLLPRCGHVFHVGCIDTWLRAHVSCPICRAHILPLETPILKEEEEVVEIAVGSTVPEATSLVEEEEEEEVVGVVPENPIDPSPENIEEMKVEILEENSSKEVESSSGSGKVFFFARMNRGRSSSVLPL